MIRATTPTTLGAAAPTLSPATPPSPPLSVATASGDLAAAVLALARVAHPPRVMLGSGFVPRLDPFTPFALPEPGTPTRLDWGDVAGLVPLHALLDLEPLGVHDTATPARARLTFALPSPSCAVPLTLHTTVALHPALAIVAAAPDTPLPPALPLPHSVVTALLSLVAAPDRRRLRTLHAVTLLNARLAMRLHTLSTHFDWALSGDPAGLLATAEAETLATWRAEARAALAALDPHPELLARHALGHPERWIREEWMRLLAVAPSARR